MTTWLKRSVRWLPPVLLFIDVILRFVGITDLFVRLNHFLQSRHILGALVSTPGLILISTLWLTILILGPSIYKWLPLWMLIGTTIHLRTWIDESERHEILHRRLRKCKRSEKVRFISFTGKSVLLPYVESAQKLLHFPFPQAVDIGVKFQGLLLDPDADPKNVEADFRSSIETPNGPKEKKLFYRDAALVAELRETYKQAHVRFDPDQLEFRYIKLGLQFSLWLFNDVALIEPYHLGRRTGNLHLCEFAQMIIPRSDINYQLLEDHFNNLWESPYTRLVWP